MALDRVNHRLFIPEPGNIRILVYQLDEQGRHVRHTADHVIGHRSLLGRRRNGRPNRTDATGSPRTGLAFDNQYQRLFVRDGSRILVFDLRPDRTHDYPSATHVIGQPDFETRVPRAGRRGFSGGGAVIMDQENQRLFVQDRERVLVFDVHPDRLVDFPQATHVIGQGDFDSRQPGIGPGRMSRINGITLDPKRQRLFVSDLGNNRVLIFDVHPERLTDGPEAIEVMGQPDFSSRDSHFRGARALPEGRAGLDSITAGGLDYDWVHDRLFVSQLVDNRVLVFDAAPERLKRQPHALAVLGQPDMSTFEPRVSGNRFAFPKDPAVDSDTQLLYVSEGFPGGNRVMAFDIRPEVLRDGVAAVDVVGHIDDLGRDDFERRRANDRLDGRTTTLARAVALDPVDHRLWVADEYNSRVLGFQLDRQNRLYDRKARWVFGQKDFYTAKVSRSRAGMAIPLAVAYDSVDKRLYVGDGWNDRVLIYEADPKRLRPGGNQKALYVLGQADFESQDPRPTRNRFDFAVDLGRGIASNMLPVGIAIDEKGRRAFIADGGNHRVLVFDIHRDGLENGANAVAVLGQPDFSSHEPSLSASGMSSPGHMAYDPDHDRLFLVDDGNQRVLVFDVRPDRLRDGMSAETVIGQPDFNSTEKPRVRGAAIDVMTGDVVGPQRFLYPNGVAYDSARQRLFVSDKGHDRVMVFDVNTERIRNFPYAVAVLGQHSEESHSSQIEADRSGQDQLYDPRGLAFDSRNRHLYVTDSHWARLMVFDVPEANRAVDIPVGGVQTFSALDPFVVLNTWTPKRGAALLEESMGLVASIVLTRTHRIVDEPTEQQTRYLVSHTAGRVKPPGRHWLLLIRQGGTVQTTLFLANPQRVATTVKLTLRDGKGRRLAETSHRLEGRGSLSSTLEKLLGSGVAGATLEVEAQTPVSAMAWSRISNRHGEEVVTILPAAGAVRRDRLQVAANLLSGGGYTTELLLLNDSAQESQGEVVLYTFHGEEQERRPFRIPPAGLFRWMVSAENEVPGRSYAAIRTESGEAPLVSSLLRRSDGGLITESAEEAVSGVRHTSIPFSTLPDLIRHGRRSDLEFTVANPGALGASLRFILKDLDGREIDRHEQLIHPHSQRAFLLSDFFDHSRFAGTLQVASDVEVALSARQRTINVREEEVLTALPIFEDGWGSGGNLMFPYLDQEGEAARIVITSTGDSVVRSQLKFLNLDGQAMEVIVR